MVNSFVNGHLLKYFCNSEGLGVLLILAIRRCSRTRATSDCKHVTLKIMPYKIACDWNTWKAPKFMIKFEIWFGCFSPF